MTRLGAAQLAALNHAILALYEGTDEPQLVERVLDLLEELLPISWISVDEAVQGSTKVAHCTGRRLEVIPDVDEKIARFCRQNPVVAQVLDGHFDPALKVSDFTTHREFRRTAFYHEIARFMPGWRDQAAVALRLPGRFVGIGLNRDTVFTEEELLMLALLQPHIERALQRSLQYLTLPAEPHLTPREREVLHWVSEGKRDHEIARIVQLSVRTVEQHVRSCLRKLRVETRSAATAEVWRARSRSSCALLRDSSS